MTVTPPLLAVALDGAGRHPAAWRTPEARPAELFTARYWLDLIREAETGGFDLVTLEDSFGAPNAGRADRVHGRLDAVLTASAIAPNTSRIGLVPTLVASHTEPFHLAKAIATLDYASTGRAGLLVRTSADPAAAAHVGRRPANALSPQELIEEGADYIEVVRRLWDSWEDDAEIRDAATGRFVDRDKLHYIDFTGRWFSVKGPSITPRPPQGQPPVFAPPELAHVADAVLLPDWTGRQATDFGGRHVFGDLVVFLDGSATAAQDRLNRLDDLDGTAFDPGSPVFTGTPAELLALINARNAGLTGFRLIPGTLPHDLTALTRYVLPRLRTGPAEGTLRDRLGLTRPASRYATETQ
ncbi:LLM class flavin-dependent oxidoreductase [Amycolatopsis sp. 195334CR]|uniref:LLM class flavin-dependent oxidoreductase n=1 Tax=Amycolatopsis sp. 195334CR TaxID=2814588 RepID=UPI001A901A14|nr:LLM class flavin-dependent oxidoreductase [Amycolatopsis sp. 195334CR]MBN6039658.1 LLM class flavin-dependent oxidoreductase [Amycolatopsis sp. 195334CR]